MHVGEGAHFGPVGGESQATRCQRALEDLVETRFIERCMSGRQHCHLLGVHIKPEDLVTQIGHARRMSRSEVPGADDGEAHPAMLSAQPQSQRAVRPRSLGAERGFLGDMP